MHSFLALLLLNRPVMFFTHVAISNLLIVSERKATVWLQYRHAHAEQSLQRSYLWSWQTLEQNNQSKKHPKTLCIQAGTPAEAMLTASNSVEVRGGGASPSSGVSAPPAARSPLSSCSMVPRSGSSIVQYSAANGTSFARDAPVPVLRR